MKNSYKLISGVFLCLISTIAWGGMFPVMDGALKIMDPFYFTALRYTSASIIFFILLVIFEGRKAFNFKGKILPLWLFGSAGFAGFGFLVFLGQQMISGAKGAIIAAVFMATMPLMSAVVSWVATGKKPNKFTFIAIFIALIGVLLVITNGNLMLLYSMKKSLLADIFMLLGAFSWVIYTWGITKFAGFSPLRYTALTCATGVVTILFAVVLATALGWLHVPAANEISGVWQELSYMILIAGVPAVFTWNAGNKIIGPVNGVLFINAVPVTTLIIASLSGRKVTLFEMSGALLVIAALGLNNIYQRKALRITAVKDMAYKNVPDEA